MVQFAASLTNFRPQTHRYCQDIYPSLGISRRYLARKFARILSSGEKPQRLCLGTLPCEITFGLTKRTDVFIAQGQCERLRVFRLSVTSPIPASRPNHRTARLPDIVSKDTTTGSTRAENFNFGDFCGSFICRLESLSPNLVDCGLTDECAQERNDRRVGCSLEKSEKLGHLSRVLTKRGLCSFSVPSTCARMLLPPLLQSNCSA